MKRVAYKIVSAMAVGSVYKVIAGLSDEERQIVIERVKQKLHEKFGAPAPTPDGQAAPQQPAGSDADLAEDYDTEPEYKDSSVYQDASKYFNGDFENYLISTMNKPQGQAPQQPQEQAPEQHDASELVSDAGIVDEDKVASNIAGDMKQIASDQNMPVDKVVELFQGMIGVLSHIVSPNPTVPPTPVEQAIIDRVATQGVQIHRKDKDLMADTGGVSNQAARPPEAKPPRAESRLPDDKEEESNSNLLR